jgi:hypothetical protein
MQVTPGKASGIARLQGYGELNGLSSKADLSPLMPAGLPAFAHLCDGNTPVSGAHAVGFVMNPGGK